jgi:hypothetical protein
MVQLSLRFAPYTTGYLHVQTNPKWSYSAVKTARNAESNGSTRVYSVISKHY